MKRLLLAASVLVLLSSSLLVGTAGADVGDGPSAIISNTLDYVPEEGIFINAHGPYCHFEVTGAPVTQHTHYGVGEVFGNDTAAAVGSCAAGDFVPYTLTVTVELQYFNGSGWASIPNTSGSSTSPSTMGASEGVARGNGTYDGGSPYLNRYHRAYGCMKRSDSSSSWCRPSATIWFMAP